jgi:hypothetical protein
MFNILRFAFLVTIGLVGFAWKLFSLFLQSVPGEESSEDRGAFSRGTVSRADVNVADWETFTPDGKMIID